MFPPLPAWDGVHPLVVHFPIALLLTVPVFVVLGVLPGRGRVFSGAAMILLTLGFVGLLLALSTGEAAEEQAERVAAAGVSLERHEALAETARNVFALLALAYAALLGAPVLLRARWTRPVAIGAHGVFLVAYLAGAVLLANVAHEGGRLVHEFGVRAPLAASATTGGAPVSSPRAREHEDD